MERRLMKKIKQKFPIGTLVKAIIPRVGNRPHELLGLVISHVNHNHVDCCEVFLGPNPWLPKHQVVPLGISRLTSVSRAYAKEVR